MLPSLIFGSKSAVTLRAKKSIAKAEQRKADSAEALRLKNKGYSNVAIGERMGINESSVRALLNPALQQRADTARQTAELLKDNIDKRKYIRYGRSACYQTRYQTA